MALIRSLLFALIFYPGTALYVFAAFPTALFGAKAMRRHVRWWALFHRQCARFILGITSRIEGEAPRGAMLVAAKHQSMYETLEVVLMLDAPALVMKRQLADIPFFGRVTLLYGCIPVDREGGAGALRRMMHAAQAAIAEGRPIVIFPEGTRVRPGEQPPLQSGFAGLYRALKLPVVSLALDSGRIWPRGSLVKRPGIVTFRFGTPIPPGLKRDEIEAMVHREINVLEGPDA
jgi:1-acyl-sn-glycerol-3-phosphate acyltransferase